MNFLQGYILFFFFILLLSHELVFADFTPEQKAEAVQMVNGGSTVADVARRFNASVQSVRNWVHAARQGTNEQTVPRQRQQRPSTLQHLTQNRISELLEKVEEGVAFEDLATEFNTTPGDIFRLIRSERERTGEASQLRRGLDFSLEEKSQAAEKLLQGQDLEEVAKEFNTHPINVTIWARIEEEKRRRRAQTQTVAPQKRHLAQREISEVKDEIENITINPPSLIPEVLTDLKAKFEEIHSEATFSEEVREEFLALLKEVEEELSSDGRIDFEEIEPYISDIKKIILSSSCPENLLTF